MTRLRTPVLPALLLLCLLLFDRATAQPVAPPDDSWRDATRSTLGAEELARSAALLSRVLMMNVRQDTPTFAPTFDLRLRQEILDGVLYFDPANADRNWIRLRSRAGLRYTGRGHLFEARLCNEFRKIIEPDVELDLDELILDRLVWAWADPMDGVYFSVGRQDMIWPDGLIMLEGHPLDGSRSMYHDALRLGLGSRRGELFELVAIHNSKVDPFVLAGDEIRSLADADESAFILRYETERHSRLALIWKHEDDPEHILPDRSSVTLNLRHVDEGERSTLLWELALQRQTDPGLAVAAQAELRGAVGPRLELRVGGFLYSGANGSRPAFRSPWGRWPKWSELYIYSLVPEGGPAAWSNIGGVPLEARLRLGKAMRLRMGATALFAPENDWASRGTLARFELGGKLTAGLSAHLLWEGLEVGSHLSPPDGERFHHFLRWQVNYSMK